jgi:GntR family transcriptional regulator
MQKLEENWSIEFHTGIPAYRQIMHYIQAAVANGELQPDDQLPTIRALHKKLKVNPNTVAKAYRELEHLGVISTQQGSGCFIAPGAAPRPASKTSEGRKARVKELCARFAAEARSHGIPLQEIAHHLNEAPIRP